MAFSVADKGFWQQKFDLQRHAMQVDVSEEEDQFQAVTTACLNVLILAVETRLDVALQHMTRMPWATLETVSPALLHVCWQPVSQRSLVHVPCFGGYVLPSDKTAHTFCSVISAHV